MSQHTVDDPFTGETFDVPRTSEADLDRTLADARVAARELAAMSVEERIALTDRALAKLEARTGEVALKSKTL